MVIIITAVNSNLGTFRPNTNKEKFSYTGSGQATAQRINDISQATKSNSVTSETLTLGAGAAGTTGKVRTKYAPIMDSIGAKLGYFNTSTDSDTSVAITHAALAGTEVRFDEYLTDTEIYALLSNGQYTIDYTNGIIYYKKGTSGTAGTINYKYTGQEVNISTGDIQIGAVEIKNATTDDRAEVVRADAVKTGATKVLVTQNIDSSGNIGGGSSPSTTADYKSPSDFSAAYTSNVTITLSGVPITITDNSQIKYIMMVPAAGQAKIFVNGSGGVTITHAANVLTISGAGTPFTAGDVYEVGINGPTKACDLSTDAQKTISLVNVWNRYTDPETLVTAQDLTDAYADFGSEIDMRGYTHLRVGIVLDVNDSTDITLKPLGLNEAGGIDKFEIEGGLTQAIPHTADAKYSYEFDVKGSPFVQLQAKAETVGATAGDLTLTISKIWK